MSESRMLLARASAVLLTKNAKRVDAVASHCMPVLCVENLMPVYVTPSCMPVVESCSATHCSPASSRAWLPSAPANTFHETPSAGSA